MSNPGGWFSRVFDLYESKTEENTKTVQSRMAASIKERRGDMGDITQTCQTLIDQINKLLAEKHRLRAYEQDIKVREAAFKSEPSISGKGEMLAKALEQILPAHMLPGNVGDINKVAWPFYYAFDFDFGLNPTLDINTRQAQSVQVSQEAAFLLLAVYRDFFGTPYSEAGQLGPYQIDVRDNQSSRQFNNNPIPVQTLGADSRPTWLPTPMLFLPNASMTVTMSTFLLAGESMVTVGDSKSQIMLAGLRVRIEDASAVLSTIFGQ